MLKRAERLSRGNFTKVAAARAFHTPLFTVRALPKGQDGKRQCSVVVSKKVAKTAVARNALRRRVYAALAGLEHRSVHAIVYMKPESLSASYEALKDALETALPFSK